jgi:hypothetical protein
MISFTIFIVLIGLSIVGLIIHLLTNFKKFSWKTTTDGLFSKSVLIPLGLAAIVFITASVIPYSQQMNDRYYIAFAEENIKLYDSYIVDYTAAAQKQISDYERLRAEMSRTASALQLQYYSQQADAVSNGLTDQIKYFNEKILEWKIEINRAKIRLIFRPQNKWVFGVE